MNLKAQFEGPVYAGPDQLDFAAMEAIASLAPEPYAGIAKNELAHMRADKRRALQAQEAFRFAYAKWLAKRDNKSVDMKGIPF
jgi:hypothetical protein